MMEKEYLAYVGIDFGTSGSTFSYWFPDSKSDNKESIKIKKWDGEGTANKTSTQIILDQDLNEILAFGKDCEKFIKQSDTEYLHFSNIKMYLYKDQSEIMDNYSKKKFPLVKVIAKILEKIRDEAIRELKTKKISLENKNLEECIKSIRWIITIPAIWSDKNKTCMIEASKMAKLIDDKEDPSNFFALEPEAAACYYPNSDSADKDILNHPYIICDIGGGTADITTHERIKDENGNYQIKELYPPSGGANGSTEINKYIFEEILVKKLFSEEAYNRIKEKMAQEGDESEELRDNFIKIKKEINDFKETFRLEDINKNKKLKINFGAFKKGFEKTPNIKDLLDNYNKNTRKGWEIEAKSWILPLPYQIILDLLNEFIVVKASDYMKNIINALKGKNEIKSIILVGGTTANPSMIDLFKKEMQNDIKIVSCDDPEVAVVRGAIYFAKDPYIISERKAKYSLGIEVEGKWIDKFESIPEAEKEFDDKKGNYICLNRFFPFYKKNETIDVRAEGKKRKLGMNSEECTLKFYKSDYNGPVYVIGQKNEDGNEITEKFGELKFKVKNFDYSECDVNIEIKLGGTLLTAKIEYIKTKETFFTQFSFD